MDQKNIYQHNAINIRDRRTETDSSRTSGEIKISDRTRTDEKFEIWDRTVPRPAKNSRPRTGPGPTKIRKSRTNSSGPWVPDRQHYRLSLDEISEIEQGPSMDTEQK